MIRGDDLLAAGVLFGALLAVAVAGALLERWHNRRRPIVIRDYARYRSTLAELEAMRDDIRLRSTRPLARVRR